MRIISLHSVSKQIDQTFSYKVPIHLKNKLNIGSRCLVPFGNRKLEGFVIDINEETGQVYVDGVLQEEAYINKDANFHVGEMNNYPLEVADDHVFVMGDNRGHSLDSRALGLIDNDEVIGKAVFRIWPFNKFGGLYKNLE